jgi:predicted enzyme related to lactoylglutathione lyase
MINDAASLDELKDFYVSAVTWAKKEDQTAILEFTKAKDKRKAELE